MYFAFFRQNVPIAWGPDYRNPMFLTFDFRENNQGIRVQLVKGHHLLIQFIGPAVRLYKRSNDKREIRTGNGLKGL